MVRDWHLQYGCIIILIKSKHAAAARSSQNEVTELTASWQLLPMLQPCMSSEG